MKTYRTPNCIGLLATLISLALLAGCGGGNGGGGGPATTITSVTVSCSPSTIQVNQSSKCTPAVTGTGSFDSSVTWSVDNGTIDANGNYSAPASPATATVKAISKQDSTKSGTATITVQAAPTITSVAVSCNPTTVPEGQTSQCSAMVQGTGNFDSSVTWSVDIGNISSSGLFTAPNATGTATVKATSKQDSTKSGTASLMITPPPGTSTLSVASTNPSSGVAITVSPSDNTGQGNGTTQFTRTYNNGVVVTLGAPSTAGGNNFSNWTGCDSVSSFTCTVTINADRAVTANYVTPPPPGTSTLSVASTNPSSGVAITVSPSDNSGQGNATTQFTRTYNNGVVVTLGAPSTAGGNNFANWTGCDSVSGTACTVTINANRTVTANYVPPPPGQARCAYVANHLSSNVSAYTVDPLTGKLGNVAGSPFAVVALPSSVAADLVGRSLYIANSALTNSLWVSTFAISSNCALTELPGSPFPPISLSFDTLTPTALAVHRSGNFLYMSSLAGGVRCFQTVSGFPPCSDPLPPAGPFQNSIALHPTGTFAYVTDQSLGNVWGYSVNLSSGGLTPVAGSPFADNCKSGQASCLVAAIAVDPFGRFAYVANSDATICVYNIDATSGKLLPRLPCFVEPNLDVAGFTGLTVHPSGNFVLASAPGFIGSTPSGFATVYRVDSNGDLSVVSGSPFPAGTGPSSITVDGSGQYVYVTAPDSTSPTSPGSISCYAFDANTGVLRAFDCGVSQTGPQPSSIAVTP